MKKELFFFNSPCFNRLLSNVSLSLSRKSAARLKANTIDLMDVNVRRIDLRFYLRGAGMKKLCDFCSSSIVAVAVAVAIDDRL